MREKTPYQSMDATTWVIVPAYNEQTYLVRVLRKILKITDRIVVVDDGSKDETADLAREFCQHVLVHSVNLGKGAALKTGCDYAFEHLGASAVILIDADDQHDPNLLPEFSRHLRAGSPVVLGVRDLHQMPLIRKVGNTIASSLVYFFFGTYFSDIPSGYKACTKSAYELLKWHSAGYSVEMEIAVRMARHKLNYTQITIPTIYHDLNRGMTVLDVLGMLGQIIGWRFKL